LISLSGDRLTITGGLTMSTVPALYAQGLSYLQKQNLVIDFAGVDTVDSSAVSLLFGWLRFAQQSNRDFQVENLPTSLQSLAGLYGVADFLPMQKV
jgi:phospholipid transport system transporter-binding protein